MNNDERLVGSDTSMTRENGEFVQYGYFTAMRKYFVFKGRSSRQEYWRFFIANAILTIGAIVIDVYVFSYDFKHPGGNPIGLIVSVIHVFPALAVAIRRLHDIDKSGWWIMLLNIPLVGLPFWIIWLTRRSDAGDNRYGPNPYAPAHGSGPRSG